MSHPRTIFEKIAAILHPLPEFSEPADESEHDAQADYRDAVLDERERLAEQLEAAYDAAHDAGQARAADPLLTSLRAAQERRKAADADIRRLIAYGREFVKPRPYRLEDLAEAAGMSYSGVRTAYDVHTIADVADAIGVTMMPASDDPGDVLSIDLTGKRGPVVITKEGAFGGEQVEGDGRR